MTRGKRRLAILFCMLALCLSLALASAETYSGYTTQNMNVRVEAGGEGQIVAKLGPDVHVQVLDEKSANGKSWLLISFEENGEAIQGYVIKKGVERAVEMEVYSGIYSLKELNAGAFQQAETGQTGDLPQNGEATVVYDGYGVYSGSFSGGKRNGTGTFLWENGDSYAGKWKADKISGKGTLKLADGTIQEGTFKAGKLYSGSAQIPQIDGGVLIRTVSEGEVRTAATLIWPDGTTLEGRFSSKTGTFSGNVTIAYQNGDSYVGPLQDSLKSGQGTYTWKNGAHYVGEWKNDKMEGSGTYYFGKTEKNNYIKGQFSANAPKGTMVYVSGQGLRYNTAWSGGKCVSISAK